MQFPPHIAYLYSRYPVVSQTFCDTEMMALEARGFQITIGSLNPPTTSFRHERLANLKAEILYPPPRSVLDAAPPDDPLWLSMEKLATQHEQAYGSSFKALTRAHNAYYFAIEFKRRGIQHVHVHFANRATHTALFLKPAGLTYSFTAHAQDFMIDLGSHDLLREMAREAEFVVAVSDFSKGLLQELCSDSAGKIIRIYNGLDPAAFVLKAPPPTSLRVLSVGRLIDFKGFPDLIDAVVLLRQRGVDATLDIVGQGPQQAVLETMIREKGAAEFINLLGVQSQDRILAMLEQCHVFALGCIVDAKGASDILPTVILEAMAASRPVVSTRLVGVPEMVIHGETGLLAEPGDPVGLADHLQRLASDTELRNRMGAAGRSRLESIFSLTHTAGQLAERFRPLAGEREREINSPLLCLLPTWSTGDEVAQQEVEFLSSQSAVELLSLNAPSKITKPVGEIHFLPDAMVLESTWRNQSHLATKVESLYRECGSVDGEIFFRDARRAVYLAGQLPHWGVRHVHALRSESMLIAWILHRLTGVPISCAIESQPTLPRSVISSLLPAFSFGSCADAKLTSCLWPDSLGLATPSKKRNLLGFSSSPPPGPDIAGVWKPWLERIQIA